LVKYCGQIMISAGTKRGRSANLRNEAKKSFVFSRVFWKRKLSLGLSPEPENLPCFNLFGSTDDPDTAARLFLSRTQFVECALQLLEFLSSLAELSFCCQALVVGQVLAASAMSA